MAPQASAPSPREAALAAELAQVREALRRSEQLFRAAFGRQFQFMAILSPQGAVLDFNEQLLFGGGLPREQVIGQPFWDTPWWQDQPALRAAWPRRLQEAAVSPTPVLTEDAYTSSDGQSRWASAAVHAVRGDGGTIECFIVQATDITERKQAEALRGALEAQWREAQKMEAIGTLAGGIAHDFNNILGAILGNVALARESLPVGHPALQPLDQVKRAGRRARSLVQRILAFSRRSPQDLHPQPLQPIVQETLALLRTTLPAGVRIATRLAPSPLWVRCDGTQMQQVLMNLCTNAWQALPEGRGRVEVGLEGLPDGRVHLWVADNGTGIDTATRGRIFEPFFTTKPVDQGTGLGLSVVHGIVVEHGGSISVDSSPGAGSVFHVHLPGVDAGVESRPSGDSALAPLSLGQGRQVLYLDDDDAMSPVAERLLQRAGYGVTLYTDPEAALSAVRAAPTRWDLVVTDYNMPGLNGLEVAQELMRLNPRLPVLLSSGYITDELRARAQRQGVRHLLHKEKMLEDLCREVGRALDSARDAGPV